MKKTLKYIIFIFILIFSIGSFYSAKAFDHTYEYNLFGLGDLKDLSPGYIGTIALTEESEVFIFYEAWDCDITGDFFIELQDASTGVLTMYCMGSHNDLFNLETGTVILPAGNYNLFYDKIRDDKFKINDIFVGITALSSGGTGSTGTGTTDTSVINNNYAFRELHIFETQEELRTFLILQNGFFGIIYFMLFAVGLLGFRFKR